MDGDLKGIQSFPAQEVLNRLMPMHILLDQWGCVLSCGPTIGRALGRSKIVGASLWDIFAIRASGGAGPDRNLAELSGRKLRLSPQQGETAFRFRGLLLQLQAIATAEKSSPTDEGTSSRNDAAWILNLSFGIDLPKAVAHLALTDGDFAFTDLALELLYLAEANVAVTGELRALAQRLEGARLQAREESLTDTLTGLRNRRAFDSVLTRLCREGAAFALMHMDLDYFKAVNDTLGHAAGDHVLVQVASILKGSARAQDCVARVGGDEFVLLLPGLTDAGLQAALAERIIKQVSQPIHFNGNKCRISASFGYVSINEGADKNPSQALAEADLALYAAKKAGRGRAVPFHPTLTEQGET